MAKTATAPYKPVTDAINAIAAEVNLPLGLAADLMKAIADWGKYSAALERERISDLAAESDAIYPVACTEHPCRHHWTDHMRPFADLLDHMDTGSAAKRHQEG